MVCPQFAPIIGGAEVVAERLAIALAARGHQVTIFTERRDLRWPRVERRDGIAIERVPCIYRRHLHRLSAQAALGWRLARRLAKLDLVHLNQPGPLSEVVLGLARASGRPTVIMPMGTGPLGIGTYTGGWRGLLGRALERRSNACVALTSAMASEAHRFGIPPHRIHVIPSGIDTAHWSPAGAAARREIRAAQGIGLDDVVVLYIGRLSPEKNVRGLVDAWARLVLRPAVSPTRLVLVGDGPERAALQSSIAALGLQRGIHLAGRVPDTLPWYHAADLFALASEHEGLPTCIVEAMSCGLPVVAVGTAVPEEVFGGAEAGALVATWDAEAYAAALYRLIVDAPLRHRCGAAARDVARARYSLDVAVERLEALYGSLFRTRVGHATNGASAES